VGRATALELARAGCDVDITFRRSADEAEDTVAALRSLGSVTEAFAFDLDHTENVEAFVSRYHGARDRLDVLVHNASIYQPAPLAELTPEVAERFMRVNAVSPLLLTAGLADLLRKSTQEHGGAVVCMCDMHAMGRPRKDFAPYTMSKAALVEMVRSLALDLAPSVRVTGVAPGVVAFPEEGYESDKAMQERYLSRVPLARAGTEDDAAEAVRWLALEAGYVTGEIIRLDGGRWLA
jgi:pteridine reductase